MRAMRAEQFSGYEALKLVELPKPTVTDGKVLVRVRTTRRRSACTNCQFNPLRSDELLREE